MVKIVYENGVPFLDIDGKLVDPAAFGSFRPRPDNVSLATRVGLELMMFKVSGLPCMLGVPYSLYGGVWKGDGVYDFSAFDNQLEMFRCHAPNAYFNVLIHLDMCPWFAQTHPDEDTNSYRHITEAALNEEWKRSAADYLQAFITYAEEKYSDCIWAYSMAAGVSNEWFDDSLYDTAFDRENTRLTALWRKEIGKSDAPVPTLESLQRGSGLRAPDSDEYRYLQLATQQTGDLICYFAAEAQKALRHHKPFGLYYGYAMTQGFQIYWNTNGYEQVFQCPDIDILYVPAAYDGARLLSGVSSYQQMMDSLRLNNKLYLHECDHRTALARYPLETGFIHPDCYETFWEWQQVYRRELCNIMQKQAAFWWLDFFGGYFSAPEYEAELKHELEIFREMARGERHSIAEIAVFVDPMSYLCIRREHGWTGYDQTIRSVNELLRCGAPFELYNLSDLPRLNVQKYKMFVFLNGFLMTDEMRAFIAEKLAGKTRFFASASGMWDGKAYSAEHLSRLCGMQVALREGGDSASVYRGVQYSFTHGDELLLQVEDPAAEVLARYADGAVSCARKGNSVYTCIPHLPWQLWRDIAKDAGIHIWDHNGGGTAVCSQFVGAYTTLREDCELHMQQDGVYREMFSGKRYECRGGVLRYSVPKGTTMLFVRESC